MLLNRTKATLRQVEIFIKSFQDIFEGTFAKVSSSPSLRIFQVSMKLVKRLIKFAEAKHFTQAHLPFV